LQVCATKKAKDEVISILFENKEAIAGVWLSFRI
jgi:hypothetical protein